ncbi:MAG: ABC transporter permease [Alphaproteobacteria bacterium]|jgi:peptide/nickel transport system permease protein|nr:ABC transporter permease [Alphaproteobacteria bacterium]MDP6567154.1 ABC transporter permease [Alphaproteobacteria bacterium]MDP6815257.1 ABC transporter permease [Alphaproteobacteria bacterium]
MRRVAWKALYMIPVALTVTLVTYLLLNLLPGDVTALMLGDEAPKAAIEQTRQALHLDDPVLLRYGRWLLAALGGDLGRSYITGQQVAEALGERFMVSCQLMLMAQGLALLLAVPTGILAGYRAGRPIDRLLTGAAFGIVSLPIFVQSMLLMIVFAVVLRWLPSTGYVEFGDDPWGSLRSLVLPAVAIGLAEWPALMRVLRSDIIATLQEDFILLARSKGLPPGHVLFRHALRPSCLSIVTVIGLQIAGLINGALIVETIFALPGLGRLLVEAVHARDLLIVQGAVTLIAVIYVVANLGVDLLYAAIDPRIRR